MDSLIFSHRKACPSLTYLVCFITETIPKSQKHFLTDSFSGSKIVLGFTEQQQLEM